MKTIITDGISTHRRTAIMENGKLTEFIYEEDIHAVTAGTIYMGIIKKILPSNFAFIDVGGEKNAFLNLKDKKESSIWHFDEEKNKNVLDIKEGMSITVQVEKEETEIKGAYLTTVLSFVGKYTVVMKNDTGIGISKKIEDVDTRRYLKRLAARLLPKGYGIIMRTECENASEKEINDEIQELVNKCADVLKKSEYIKAPAVIYRDYSPSERAVRDLINSENDKVITNDKEFFKSIKLDNKEFYNEDIPIFERYGVSEQLKKALHNKIWLDCGAFLVFDYAEACTVIDVNTGKCTGSDHRKTVLKTNLEAAEKIAWQIRLKNLSGMIIIDFIDMIYPEDRKAVMDKISEEIKKDSVTVNVLSMTELGLLQMTRKKVRKPLHQILLKPCPFCSGTGFVENEGYIADKIREKVISIFTSTVFKEVIVSANHYVINAFKGKNNDYKNIESKFGKKILLNVIETQKYDYFNIEKR